MPVSVRLRMVARTAFNRLADEIEQMLDHEEVDYDVLGSKIARLERRIQELEEMDRAILEEMLSVEDMPDVDMDKETKEADDIAIRGLYLCRRSKAILDPSKPIPVVPQIPVVPPQPGVVPHRYKLPKIELNKFGGEIKDWTPFWCLFQKIGADPMLQDEDKFHYLLQCITPGTRARKLVESYPPTKANYAKAIDALRARFGREDLLIEYYFRELLTLTLSFGKSEDHRGSLADVFDLVETQLNALETLGVATNTFAMALFPLVESCLSEDQLRTWRRSELASAQSASDKLQGLLKFLEKEVQIEEAIRSIDKRFASQHIQKGKPQTSTSARVPTAAELVANSSPASASCVFCEEAHTNASCKKAEDMTIQERKKILGSNNCCYRCMRKGHRIDKCRVSLTCGVCQRRHATLMCYQGAQRSAEEKSDRQENNLASTSPVGEHLPQVFLQTLVVVARAGTSKGKEQEPFCCPTTLRPKLMLQRCWDGKGGWQEEIPEELQVEFLSWYHELSYVESIRIPRWLTGEGIIFDRSVHTFCDASKIAYSAVVYLRSVTSEGVVVHLIQAKSRVTPSADITMPRLELLAALIGARLANSVKEVLGGDVSYTFWSDSSTVITWINRDDNWGVFLHNRVTEIRSLSRKEEWRHVPGILNPADLPSRGCSPRQLFESRWWEGPSWLRKEKDSWPSEDIVVDESEIKSEKKRKERGTTVDLFIMSADPHWFCSLSSDYEPTVRLVAWVLRFVSNSRARKNGLPFKRGSLLCREIGQAEKFILRSVQQESFSSVKDSKIEPLVAFVDSDGLMKLRTKVTERKDTYDFRFPILLPSDHVIVEKLVLSEHRRACHVGVQGLLSILRDRFWILRGRQTVRSILTKCINCARYEVKHAEALNPTLPESRTRDAEVFEVTGVDFFGPFILRDERKVYGVIFTCAVYRAVHLELAVSLSTCTFIQVLRRFIARRGRPAIIYSDNAKNFTGAEAAFKKLDWDKLSKFCTTERIDWRFNPPSGPWWGGWWERLIGIIKQLLRKTLGKASVTYEELETLLCDCEATMNARPLTYVSEDDSDLVPITPNLFLRGSRDAGVPDCDALSATGLGERAQFIQKLRTEMRKRFRNEYLGKLARIAKQVTRKLKIGEIVLFGSDDKKRIDWPLGRIIGFIPGKDGENRVVRLITANGEVMRPLQRVYPLEVCFDDQKT